MPATPQSSLDLPGTANSIAIDGVLRLTEPEAGSARPVVVTSPHAGRIYSDEMRGGTLVTLKQLRRSEDAFVDDLVDIAPEFGATFLCSECPRVFVDVNRGPGELDPGMFADRIPEGAHTPSRRSVSGLGVIPRVGADGRSLYRRRLRFSEAKTRLSRFYEPYHQALTDVLQRLSDQFGTAVLLDMHSMPDHSARGADIILGDLFGQSCDAQVVDTAERLFQSAGFVTVRNTPYAGGFTTEHYGQPKKGVHVLQIEMNRALYMDEYRVVKSQNFDAFSKKIRKFISDFTAIDWASALTS